jgi:hypothetical protein
MGLLLFAQLSPLAKDKSWANSLYCVAQKGEANIKAIAK